MKRIATSFMGLLALRIVPLAVMLCFLLLYAGLAFFNDEPLTTLILLTKNTPLLVIILALIPLNLAIRLVIESKKSFMLRSVLAGRADREPVQGLFDEYVSLTANADLSVIKGRLESFGYRTRLTDESLAAFRGITLYPARALMLTGACFLFAGILISTSMRSSRRVPVIEGEVFPLSKGVERVERLLLVDSPGLFLARMLFIEVSEDDGRRKVFGIYPPALHEGSFVYPRYLGIAPLIRFSASDFPRGFATHYVLMIYPPGKEDSVDIPETGYKIVFSMLKPKDRQDPFQSGRIALQFRVMKEDRLVVTGIVPLRGEFNEKGYHLSFPDFRRVVAADLVKDQGVIMIWTAFILLFASLLYWLPIRLFCPRREMLFWTGSGCIHACSRAEGRRTGHSGVFIDALDFLDSQNSGD